MSKSHIAATASQVPAEVVAFIVTLKGVLATVMALFTPVYDEEPSKRFYFVAGLLWSMLNKKSAKQGVEQGAKWYAQAALAHSCSDGSGYLTPKGVLAPWASKGGLTLANGKVGNITAETLTKAFGENIPDNPSNINGMLGHITATLARKGQPAVFFATVQSAGGNVALFTKGLTPVAETYGKAPVPQPAVQA